MKTARRGQRAISRTVRMAFGLSGTITARSVLRAIGRTASEKALRLGGIKTARSVLRNIIRTVSEMA